MHGVCGWRPGGDVRLCVDDVDICCVVFPYAALEFANLICLSASLPITLQFVCLFGVDFSRFSLTIFYAFITSGVVIDRLIDLMVMFFSVDYSIESIAFCSFCMLTICLFIPRD